MAKFSPSRATYLVLAVICLAIAISMALQLSRSLREDFYWTPSEQSLPLPDARERLEVYLEGELLQRHASAGRLLLEAEDGTTRQVGPEDLTVRTNDFDRVARGQMILLAGALTAGLVLLVVGWLTPGRRRADG